MEKRVVGAFRASSEWQNRSEAKMKRKGSPSCSSSPGSSSVVLVEPEVRKSWSENPNTRSRDIGVQRRLSDADEGQLCRECLLKKPHFFKVLIGDFRKRLMLPPAFLKQLRVGESGAAVVADQSNRCWDVELLRKGNGTIFSKGWRQFVDENDLNAGDFLVFQYDGELHFTVTIFDKSSCEKNMEKRCPKIKARDASSSFKTTNPSFKIVVGNSLYAVRVPADFPDGNLPKKACWLTFEDSVGRQWFVKYIKTMLSCNGRYLLQRSLSAGWRKFSVENCLKKEDVLVFELIRGNRVFKVHFFSKRAE